MKNNICRKIFSSFLSLVLVLTLGQVPVFAAEPSYDKTDLSSEKIATAMPAQEVKEELKNQIEYYQSLRARKTDIESQNKIDVLITATQNLLDSYEENSNEKTTNADSAKSGYDVAIAAVVAAFNKSGYRLSSELLTYMTVNKSPNTNYTPVNDDVMIGSPVLKKVWSNRFFEPDGSSNFPSTGAIPGGAFDPNVKASDLYYSIHAFDFVTSYQLGNEYIILTDVYDYSEGSDYPSIAGVAIEVMYQAQQAGVLTPYHITIEIDPYDFDLA